MGKFFYLLKAVHTYFLGIVLYHLGGFDGALSLLLLLVAVDVITGVLCAIRGASKKTEQGFLSSTRFTEGLVKKVAVFLTVVVATAIDRYLGSQDIRILVVSFLCGEELLSILENLGLLGVKYPEKLREMIEILKGE